MIHNGDWLNSDSLRMGLATLENPAMLSRVILGQTSTWAVKHQSCLCSGSPVKSLGTEAWLNVPCWHHSMCLVTYQCQESDVSWLCGERTVGAPRLVFPWTTTHVLPLLTDFHLFSFPVKTVTVSTTVSREFWESIHCQNWEWLWDP